MRILEPWYKAISDVLDEFAKRLSVSEQRGPDDRSGDRRISSRSASSPGRRATTSGRECGTARPFVGTAKPFTPQARETITDMRGRTDATLQQLVGCHQPPRRGARAIQPVAEVRGHRRQGKGRPRRDLRQARRQQQARDVARQAWTEMCAGPFDTDLSGRNGVLRPDAPACGARRARRPLAAAA